MNIDLNSFFKGLTLQKLIAYAGVVFGVLTTTLSGIKLPGVASLILGIFGTLLHPNTGVVSSPPTPPAPTGGPVPPTL